MDSPQNIEAPKLYNLELAEKANRKVCCFHLATALACSSSALALNGLSRAVAETWMTQPWTPQCSLRFPLCYKS